MSLNLPLEDFVFVTMDEFETFLHRDLNPSTTDPDTDEPLDPSADENTAAQALTAACQIVLDFVGDIRLWVGDEVLVDGTGTDSIVLPFRPVWRVNSVLVDDSELTADDDWRLGQVKGGVLYRMGCSWPWGRARVTVNLDHGYVFPAEEEDPDAALAEPVPASLKEVAMSIAARVLAATRLVNVGVGTTSGPDPDSVLPAGLVNYITEGATFSWGREQFTVQMTALERNVLAKYRVQGGLPYYRATVDVS